MNRREPQSVNADQGKVAVRGIEYRSAVPADEAGMRSLLSSCDLPHEDIADHLPQFIVASHGDWVVGTVGLEVLGHSGLLRSLAVAGPWRDQGLATGLFAVIAERARQLGIAELWLLTTTAEGLFAKLGFRTVSRAGAPPEVQATLEFRSLCPESAVCMRRRL